MVISWYVTVTSFLAMTFTSLQYGFNFTTVDSDVKMSEKKTNDSGQMVKKCNVFFNILFIFTENVTNFRILKSHRTEHGTVFCVQLQICALLTTAKLG